MDNNFDDYLKQLQGLENSENIASLKTLRDMHSNVLSSFPTIIDGINRLIGSSSVQMDTISDIKEKIPVLSRCRQLYEELSACEKSRMYGASIEKLLRRKEVVTLLEVNQYQSDLSDMLQKNEAQIKTEKSASVQPEIPTRPAAPITTKQLTDIWQLVQQGKRLQAVSYFSMVTKIDLKNCKDYIDKLSRCNSFDEAMRVGVEVNKNNGTSGCYVATAVYGSYDCPEVWTLRRYRDNILDSTWYGRLFIKIYYTISPTLVKWFGSTEWFRNLFLAPLNRWVTRLNQRGFENTPYEDKY